MTGSLKILNRSDVDTFAVLPAGTPCPEGLTVAPNGDVYVTTFGFDKDGPVTGPGQLLAFKPNGKLIRQVEVKGSSPILAGLGFNPVTGDLIILDFPNQVAVKVDPKTGESSVFMTVTGANPFLNGLTFDRAGNLYVSDCTQGIVWKTGPQGGAGVIWSQEEDLLKTKSGFPPVGVNGIDFNVAQTALVVSNTGNSTVVTIPVQPDGTAGAPVLLANGVVSADGLVVDRNDNIWVACNQSDQILVLDATGRLLAKFGQFEGVSEKGLTLGLLFPASLEFSPDGEDLYVSNTAVDLRFLGNVQAVDSFYASKVKLYTISKIRVPHRLRHPEDD